MDRDLLAEMVETLETIGAVSQPSASGDGPLPEVVVESVRILGTAAASLSPGLRQRRPEVPWGRLSDLAERVAPGYGPDAAAAVRQFAVREVPLLDMQLRSVLGSLAF
jgi:uncharacterized protein with HEPN domain